MKILHNISLKDYTTMRLGGRAEALATAHSREELLKLLAFAEQHAMRVFVLGGGSNVLSSGDFDGLIIINRLQGFEVIAADKNSSIVKVGAGEEWDEVVQKTVAMDLCGIEKLSAIPGTAGATPVQNVGAYGAEIADVLLSIEAYDVQAKTFVVLNKAQCRFGYRTSIFKSVEGRRYIIISITLQLHRTLPQSPFYPSLQKYLDEYDIHEHSPQVIREAVIAIRKRVLPDPRMIANAGSFFKNPFVDQAKFENLIKDLPTIPHWPTKDGRVKLAAGWLIDQAGLKGYGIRGMRVYTENALVFVNEGAKTYADLTALHNKVVKTVYQKFGIILEREPETI